MPQPFSTSGAIASQSNAHARLQAAIASGAAVRILWNGVPYMTAESLAAAKLVVGKSKRMTIVPY